MLAVPSNESIMISPQIVDRVCLAFAIIAPAYVVLRFRRWLFTIPLGAFICWFTLLVCGHLLAVLDPEREGGMLDAIWFLAGWIPSLLYTASLYALRRLFLFLRSRYMLQPSNEPKPRNA